MPAYQALLARALKIDELEVSLNNIAQDDKIKVEDLTNQQIVDEAIYVKSNFLERGHLLNESYTSSDKTEKAWAKSQVSKLDRFINRFQQHASGSKYGAATSK